MARRWTLGLGGCVLLLAGLLWALSAKDGALELSERTDMMALACAIVGLVGMFATFWRPRGAGEDVVAAVARLGNAVREVGEPQWRQSLGGDLTPIDVTFRFRPQSGARAAVLPAAPALQLAQVVEDFREIRPSRLVITGEPGAGKTVLARKLVMEFNRVRTEQEPVPVMIALADWDEDEPLAEWIARHLERDYGIPRSSAGQVLRARMVLPVLDGLDEMDGSAAPADRRRARTALEALDRYQDGTDAAPLVLTCRTSEYDAFEAEGRHILDSARIEIDPVTPDRAHLFLSRRGAARRPLPWQPVLDRLAAEPTGVLARALSTPWRLTLAATVYEPEGDPGGGCLRLRRARVWRICCLRAMSGRPQRGRPGAMRAMTSIAGSVFSHAPLVRAAVPRRIWHCWNLNAGSRRGRSPRCGGASRRCWSWPAGQLPAWPPWGHPPSGSSWGCSSRSPSRLCQSCSRRRWRL
ncbi:NACHT domain-containing protein [Streptomyces sp. P17]|uniref:NACHT domain-containing protein n=1 Tax=Streptomyces sp. P17 TaxID=3074716 RepID=UPI0028F44E60|nr:NACHT domain-containing protein [Streptomyces sp. P17]MDT9696711.1 NACHT domain-containing protein [Streptomyces sp. P17]